MALRRSCQPGASHVHDQSARMGPRSAGPGGAAARGFHRSDHIASVGAATRPWREATASAKAPSARDGIRPDPSLRSEPLACAGSGGPHRDPWGRGRGHCAAPGGVSAAGPAGQHSSAPRGTALHAGAVAQQPRLVSSQPAPTGNAPEVGAPILPGAQHTHWAANQVLPVRVAGGLVDFPSHGAHNRLGVPRERITACWPSRPMRSASADWRSA